MRTKLIAGVAAVVLFSFTTAQAQVKVFVDFTSDDHNGAGGGGGSGGDGVDWIEELNKATTTVPDFDLTERGIIEADIMSQLSTIYAGYDVTFSLTAPSAPYDVIAFGKDNTGFGSLGIAPIDQANIASSQVAEVATGNFTSTLDEFSGMTGRAAQMSQIATSLAGTAAHELGHSLGLSHHDAYSHPDIHPGTYAATAGVQNTRVMATSETGIIETEREVIRSHGIWSKAKFDITGGAVGKIAGTHHKMVTTPIALDTTEEDGADAGPSIGSAMTMTMATGESSGMLLGFVAGNADDLNGPPPPTFEPMDVDTYKIGIPGAGWISAEIFSSTRFGSGGYNTAIELLDAGGFGLAMNDNIHYDDDTFNTGTLRQTDPLLLNIPVFSAGFYYIRVTNPIPPEVGATDAYWLMAGFQPIPEPASTGAMFTIAARAFLRRSRRA